MKGKYSRKRPSIPADIKRKTAIESGHSCAVKHCLEHTYNEYHHIDGNRENNSPDNLIFLCDKHHKMAHAGQIDRKALQEYKRLNDKEKTKPHVGDLNSNTIDAADDNYWIPIDKFRALDVLEDKFVANSKEMGIKLYELWWENQLTYSILDFARLLNVSEKDMKQYFLGELPLSLGNISSITKIFHLTESHFFEATFRNRRAIWKGEAVKYSILSLAYPKRNIFEIKDKGKFYSDILISYAKEICAFYELLSESSYKVDPFDCNPPKNEISSKFKKELDTQYYKVLEQYPDGYNSRELLKYEKILTTWFSYNDKYIARVIIEGIKSIDISDVRKPKIICWFDEDIKNNKVTKQGYDESSLVMRS